MKGIRNLRVMGLLGTMVLAALLTAGLASAKEKEFVGNFTLTSETRWGNAVLPPGDYSFELNLTTDLITVRGQKQTVMIMSQVHDTDAHVESSALILVSRSGKRVIRALQLASDKVVLVYPIPKENREEVAQGPVLIERVPITINGK